MKISDYIYKSKITLLLLITLMFFSQCSKKEINMPNEQLNSLFGKWDWIGTVDLASGTDKFSLSPSTTGYTKMLEYTKYGKYIQYKNNKVEFKKDFTVEFKKSNVYGTERYAIVYEEDIPFMFDDAPSFSSDSLILMEENYDYVFKYYVKHK